MSDNTEEKAKILTNTGYLNLYNRFQEPITMTAEDLAMKLLNDPTVINKCKETVHRLTLFKTHKFHYNPSTAKVFEKALGKNNENVEWSLVDRFVWYKAAKKIMRKFGLQQLSYIGKKNHITRDPMISGLKLETAIINNDVEKHYQIMEAMAVEFKKNSDNNAFLKHDPTKCNIGLYCNSNVWKRLKDSGLLWEFT